MLKVLSNRSLEFSNPDGEVVRIGVGFGELPNWVENDDYFKAAVADGSIKEFSGNNPQTTEDLTKLSEKKASLEADVAALEEKITNMTTSGEEKKQSLKDEIKVIKEELDALKKEKKDLK